MLFADSLGLEFTFVGCHVIMIKPLNAVGCVYSKKNSFSSSILLAETVTVLSSAKLYKDLLLMIRKKSFTKILKQSGPRIDPCGTL